MSETLDLTGLGECAPHCPELAGTLASRLLWPAELVSVLAMLPD